MSRSRRDVKEVKETDGKGDEDEEGDEQEENGDNKYGEAAEVMHKTNGKRGSGVGE